MKVAVVERGRFGGTCVNTGCIPTKTLVASERAARVARRAADFGVVVQGPIGVDMKQVKARKDAVPGASNQRGETWLKGMKNVTVIEGHARFVGPHEVGVAERRLTAGKIFIDVGARAPGPKLPGIETTPFLTNSGMMQVDFLPGAPDRRRRQLHRPRVRADVQALRQPRDDRGDRAAPDRP